MCFLMIVTVKADCMSCIQPIMDLLIVNTNNLQNIKIMFSLKYGNPSSSSVRYLSNVELMFPLKGDLSNLRAGK